MLAATTELERRRGGRRHLTATITEERVEERDFQVAGLILKEETR